MKKNILESALRKIIGKAITQDDISPGGKWYKAYVDLKKVCQDARITYQLTMGTFEEEGPIFKLEDGSILLAGNSTEYVEGVFLHQGQRNEYVGTAEEMVDFLKKRFNKRERKFKGRF